NSFIVDDDGLGYADQGEEVDWSQSGVVPSSEDEADAQLDKKKVKKAKSEKKDKKEVRKASFEAAAALMGKQRISNLFSSGVFGNSNSNKTKVCNDSVIDDVLAEFTPDENDKEKRRRGIKRVVKNETVLAPSSFVKAVNVESVVSLIKNDVVEKEEPVELFDNGNDLEEKTEVAVVGSEVEVIKEECEVKDEVAVVKEGGVWSLNAKVKEDNDPTFSAAAGLQTVVSAGLDGDVEIERGLNSDGKYPFVVDSDGSLPFYVLDAYEEYFSSNAGNIYLFGKVFCCLIYSS
ncbi:hypothetical protein Tco_1349510, partial [Tanacetum coccineum]